MKVFISLLLCFLGSHFYANAQYGLIDSSAIANWPFINGEAISNDGKYALYFENTMGARGSRNGHMLFIYSSDGSRKSNIVRVNEAKFSGDSRFVLARTVDDSLIVFDLVHDVEHGYGGVKSFRVAPRGEADVVAIGWVGGGLGILSLSAWRCDTLGVVQRYGFEGSGACLFWVERVADGKEQLVHFDLVTRTKHTVWKGGKIGQVAWEGTSGNLVFLAQQDAGKSQSWSIWEYQDGADSAAVWMKSSIDQRGDSMEILESRLEYFPTLSAVVFQVEERAGKDSRGSAGEGVRIWRYNDEYGSPTGMMGGDPLPSHTFLALAYMGKPKMVTLRIDGNTFGDPIINQNSAFPYALAVSETNLAEARRRLSARPSLYLINLKDGAVSCIKKELELEDAYFSPGGKYIYWYDRVERGYFAYNIAKGRIVNVSKSVPVPLFNGERDAADYPRGYGVGRWLQDDKAMLIYDRYDIWRLDPEGVLPPVNITNGFGRAHRMRIRIASCDGSSWQAIPAASGGDSLVAACFNEETKENGFLKFSTDKVGDPVVQVMSSNAYYFPELIGETQFNDRLLKAGQATVFLVRKMSADRFPNIYATKDFKQYTALSDLAPEKKYNWLTSELVHWKTFEGHSAEGILYKPKDFDSTKKYPVICYFYETLTPQLNIYPDVEYCDGSINIPWFVSRDYLFFCPDIRYRVGEPGKGIYDYVVSGTHFLKGKKWVDGTRIGIDGHSWGGFEVNYLLTRTDAFACAASASGVSNLTSLYGLEGFSGCSGPSFVENASFRMGGILCDSVNQYIRNSPVFAANKVVTPLLIMSNDKDLNVPWEQGVEFFTVLRRLGKKVWMLEYPNAAHSLRGADTRDFTRRLTAFFDYYLKGSGRPSWAEE